MRSSGRRSAAFRAGVLAVSLLTLTDCSGSAAQPRHASTPPCEQQFSTQLEEFAGRPMSRVDDYDSTAGSRYCSVTPDYGADPELRLYPSLDVKYLLRSYPGGLDGDIELTKSGYQKDRPARSIISHSLELGDEGTSWIEQGADLEAKAMVRDETLVINVAVKTKPGTADPVALETLARKIAGIALGAASR